MLPIPNKHFSRSIKKHNIRTDIFCDWVEGSVLFCEEVDYVSKVDVADNLTDSAIYDDQGFALEGVNNGWLELRTRARSSGGGLGYSVAKSRAVRGGNWRDYPAHSFCLLVSLASVYDWWSERDYLEQGELFELIIKESFQAQFPMWEVHQTGWSRNNSETLREIATTVAEILNEELGDMKTWAQPGSKEMGLDLVCYRSFSDARQGIPIFFMQCASGNNWDTKLHTPNIDVWKSILSMKSEPIRAFATPFTLDTVKYSQSIIRVRGLFFERCRILAAAAHRPDWLSQDLRERIVAWSEPRVAMLLDRW